MKFAVNKKSLGWGLCATVFLCSMLVGAFWQTGAVHAASTTYYVDCSQSSNGSGTQARPWNSLSAVDSHGAFGAGDTILFKNRTSCSGMLDPQGSGTSGHPITISNYGTGALPIINGGTTSAHEAAIVLRNQQQWVIQNLEVTGGWYENVYVTANGNTTYTGFTLKNLTVHNNAYSTRSIFWNPDAGGIVVQSCNNSTSIRYVGIYGVTAYNTDQAGIVIGHTAAGSNPKCTYGSVSKTGVEHAVINSSNLYQNDAAGAEIFGASYVTLSSNKLHANGNGAGGKNRSLNGEGAWWDDTNFVTADSNESYGNFTGNGDGGGLDADGQSTNNTVTNNYLHDNDSYGFSIFVDKHETKTNNVVTGNTFLNNGRRSNRAGYGDIYIKAIAQPGGVVTQLTISGNRFTRTGNQGPAILTHLGPPFTITNAVFQNNTITRNSGTFVQYEASAIVNSHNTYKMAKGNTPTWIQKGRTYTTLGSFQTTGQESGSTFSTF